MDKQVKKIILFFCIIKLTLHLIADTNSGFQGDELLHIEAGKHLAWGYMEFPPLIGFLSFIQNLFHSNSIFVHHIFSHIASIIILVFLAKTTIELGGKNKAVFFVLLGFITAPGFERSQQLFQPVVFSQLFWILSFYALIRFVNEIDKKSLWRLTFFCILGFYSKYDAIFFIFGLTSLIFFKRTRNALIQNKFWWNILVFFFCILPNIIWQIFNDYPVFQMFSRLYEKHLDGINRFSTMLEVLVSINPIVSLFLFFTGIYYFATSNRKSSVAILSLSIALSFSFLLFKNGKSYYFYPIVLTVLPFGALFLEQKIKINKISLIYPISIIMLLGGILIPFGMPVYSFNRYLKKIYPFEKKEIEGGKYGVKYDEYYTKQKWQSTLQQIKFVYDSLPAIEKTTCLIWGKHYGQAGAINLLDTEQNLPKAFSYHGSFYSWTPKGQMPETIIALSYKVGDFFNPYFKEVKLVRSIYNPYAYSEEELYQRIYVCKGPLQSFNKMKEFFKKRIFE